MIAIWILGLKNWSARCTANKYHKKTNGSLEFILDFDSLHEPARQVFGSSSKIQIRKEGITNGKENVHLGGYDGIWDFRFSLRWR